VYSNHRNLNPFPTRRSSDLENYSTIKTIRILFYPNNWIKRLLIKKIFLLICFLLAVIIAKKPHLKLFLSSMNLILNWNNSIYWRSEEHTSELQSRENLVCRL